MALPFHNPIVSPTFVGRDLHLAVLRTARVAADRKGQIILISGEAGIGKSRLVAETIASDADSETLVLRGNCYESDRAAPYAPLTEIVRGLVAPRSLAVIVERLGPLALDLRAILPELPVTLPDPVPSPVDPEQQKRRLFHALTTLLARLATDAPLMIVLEDLHWSDDATLEFLRYFARRIEPHRLLLIATYRSNEMPHTLTQVLSDLTRERLATELILVPFTRAEIEAMLQAIFDLRRPVQVDFLDAIALLTDGNPFFIEETLKELIASGDVLYADVLRDHTTLSALHVPRTVQDVVQRRSLRLSPAARETLAIAAIIGRRFDFALLQEVRGGDEDPLLAQTRELLAEQLIVEESAERFAFRHALTQQAIAAHLLARERRALHRRVAEALERRAVTSDASVADLAYHYTAAEVWERALHYARRAAERAVALDSPHAAVAQWTRVLEATLQLGETPDPETYRARGRAQETVGAFTLARADYERAVEVSEVSGDRRATWQSLIDLGLLWSAHDYDQARQYFERASVLAEDLADRQLRAQTLNRLGNWLANTRDVTASLRAHEEALRLLTAINDRAGIAETHDLLGIASWHDGDMVAAVHHLGEAITGYRPAGTPYGLISALASRCGGASPEMSDVAYSALRTCNACMRDGEEALILARRIDWRAGQVYAMVQLGGAACGFGHFGDALRHGHAALTLATEIEHRQWMAAAHFGLGRTYTLLLAPDTAIRHLEAALVLARILQSPWWVGIVGAALAAAHLDTSDIARAEAVLSALHAEVPAIHPANMRRFRRLTGELALARRQPEIALHCADDLLATVPGVSRAQPIPSLYHLQGKALLALHRTEAAIESLHAARQGAEERGQRPLLWRVQVTLGDTYRQLRRDSEAREGYDAARGTIAALAETLDDAAMREQFATAARATIPKERPLSARRAAKESFGGLTTREREVAALVAVGNSNREIGAALFIGEGTVATHIGNILAKLDLTSRTQIAAWAIARGLRRSD